jgi:hypothetical protein
VVLDIVKEAVKHIFELYLVLLPFIDECMFLLKMFFRMTRFCLHYRNRPIMSQFCQANINVIIFQFIHGHSFCLRALSIYSSYLLYNLFRGCGKHGHGPAVAHLYFILPGTYANIMRNAILDILNFEYKVLHPGKCVLLYICYWQ